jgi:hypothetical protein
VYEVVGRFAFQGEDDANLARVNALVDALGDEIERQRRALAAVRGLPASATRQAEGLSQRELAEAEAERARRLEPFEPVAEQLRVQCARVLDAVRQVARPDLSNHETADAVYKDYVRRVQALYGAALPYLRRALGELCSVARVEVPASWPDALPLSAALPPDLLAMPATDSPEVADLLAQIDASKAQLASGARRQHELELERKRLESDKVTLLARENEIMAEVRVAKDIVRWATKADQIDQSLQAVAVQLQQKQSRVALVAQLEVQQQQLDATSDALATEIAQREQDLAQSEAALEKERAHPPALFGRDEWRRRVEDQEHDLDERNATLAQRRASRAQTAAESGNVHARVQTEKAQIASIDRAVDEAREREKAMRVELTRIEEALGAQRPAHRATVAEADEYLTRTWAMRNEVRARLDDATARVRAAVEEHDRLSVQARQLEAGQQQLAEALAQARVAAAAAHEVAVEAHADRRRKGFAQHVDQALAPLEESLAQVDRIFVDPARQVLLQRSVGEAPRAGSLRAQAEGLAQAIALLAPRVEPVLATQAEVLRRVREDFCDKVHGAVRAAWAS